MESVAWENAEMEIISSPTSSDDSAPRVGRIGTLKELALRLLREVQSISEVPTLNVHSGLDFYAEVHRFEIELIKGALLHTGGHQGRAARLLNLKVTTLNSKIKHYDIDPAGFTLGYRPADPGELEHQPA